MIDGIIIFNADLNAVVLYIRLKTSLKTGSYLMGKK